MNKLKADSEKKEFKKSNLQAERTEECSFKICKLFTKNSL